MEGKYFTRKLNEGTVKRSHLCSFDKTIKLELLVEGSKKVLDYLLQQQSKQFSKEEIDQTKAYQMAKENLISELSGLRINGLPILYEDLAICFDGEEILEIMAFLNGQDMSIFSKDEKPKTDEKPKN